MKSKILIGLIIGIILSSGCLESTQKNGGIKKLGNCDSIENPEERAKCSRELFESIRKGEIECNDLENRTVRLICQYSYAVKSKDIKKCQEIEDTKMKSICIKEIESYESLSKLPHSSGFTQVGILDPSTSLTTGGEFKTTLVNRIDVPITLTKIDIISPPSEEILCSKTGNINLQLGHAFELKISDCPKGKKGQMYEFNVIIDYIEKHNQSTLEHVEEGVITGAYE